MYTRTRAFFGVGVWSVSYRGQDFAFNPVPLDMACAFCVDLELLQVLPRIYCSFGRGAKRLAQHFPITKFETAPGSA